jgi:hypothetical protein
MQGLQSLNQFKNFVSSIGGLGRYEDTYIVHAAEGETVVPMEVLDRNPLLKKRLFKTMVDMGIEPGRYIVGNELNSKNPVTGQPEFFLKKIVSQIRKALPGDSEKYLGAAVGALTGVPLYGALAGGVGSGLSGALTGGIAGAALPGFSKLGGTAGDLTGYLRGLAPSKMLTKTATYLPEGIGKYVQDPSLLFKRKKIDPSILFSDITEMVETAGGYDSKGNLTDSGKILFDKLIDQGFSEKGKGKGLGTLGSLGTLAGGLALTGILGSQIPKPEDAVIDPSKIRQPERTDDFAFNPNQTYTRPEIESPFAPATFAAKGGVMDLQDGGESKGPGTGTSDSIPAMLSDGEFVMTAKAVRGAGGGDRREGARKMYEAMDKLEAQA